MSQLSPWLAFDPDYILKQNSLNQAYYAAQPPPPKPRGWALGRIYESVSLFYGIMGYGPRTPGLYRRTDYATGRPTDEMLSDTNESMHASVRVRIQRQGLGVDDAPGPYSPVALKEWELDVRDKTWTYEGPDKNMQGAVFKEEELGVFELQLLKTDRVAYDLVGVQNA